MRAAYWVTVVLVPVVFLAAMFFIDREPSIDPALLRTAVIGTTSHSNEVPAYPPADTISLDLPNFDERPLDGPASVWYRHTFDAPAAAGVWGMLIPYAARQLRDPCEWPARQRNRAHDAAVCRVSRAALLRISGVDAARGHGNTVDIHAVSDRLGSWLTPFYLGPRERPETRLRLSRISCRSRCWPATIVALGVVSVLLLGLFWIRTCDTAHGWFAAATICWAFYNWLTLEPRVLIPYARIWFACPSSTLGWFTIFSVHFVNRLPGCKRPAAHRRARDSWRSASSGSLMVMSYSQLEVGMFWVQNYMWQPGLLRLERVTSSGNCCARRCAIPTSK